MAGGGRGACGGDDEEGGAAASRRRRGARAGAGMEEGDGKKGSAQVPLWEEVLR